MRSAVRWRKLRGMDDSRIGVAMITDGIDLGRLAGLVVFGDLVELREERCEAALLRIEEAPLVLHGRWLRRRALLPLGRRVLGGDGCGGRRRRRRRRGRRSGGDQCLFARRFRDSGKRSPIVVMTAAENASRWAAEIGADGYLAKPFEIDALIAAVERHATKQH